MLKRHSVPKTCAEAAVWFPAVMHSKIKWSACVLLLCTRNPLAIQASSGPGVSLTFTDKLMCQTHAIQALLEENNVLINVDKY